MDEACFEVKRLVNNIVERYKPKVLPLLVYDTKRDLEGGMTGDEIRQALHLDDFDKDIVFWHVQEASSRTGQGLWEGLDFLYDINVHPNDNV